MSTAFSPAQLRASLWARQGSRVHAVIDGLVIPGIEEKLKGAQLAGWDCLQRGAMSAEAAARAPYLAELGESSPFTDWLLGEATPTYPGWGLLSISMKPLLPVREHCRTIGEVILPDGDRRAWRWYDPEVLQAILPTLLAGQLDEVFGLGQTIVLPAADAWTWLSMEQGVLATDVRPLMAPAR
ncbi:MAG: DUF4123 domain-containing protein [Burkholderiales bacterium]|nr:DUF4123 domain-containing protein [Burkholderiales bacterium]